MKMTTVRIDDHLFSRVDGIAKALSRPRSWIINQALERFVDYEEWFEQEVKAGLAEVERGDVALDTEVKTVFNKFGVDAG